MSIDFLSPTSEFATASHPVTLDQLTSWPRSLAFYTVERFDFATHETLGSYLQRAGEADDEQFGQNAVKSAPRSWREL